VRYFSETASSVSFAASCASDSGRVDQNATLRKVGGNVYAGRFYNQQYNVAGTIRVTVRGSTQNVVLNSESGSAVLSLHRG
jgi:hypothetical protein